MQGTNSPPAQILKEILQRLAARRLPPTPLHFTQVYNEITGDVDDQVFIAEDFIKSMDSAEYEAPIAMRENTQRASALKRLRLSRDKEHAYFSLLEIVFENALHPFIGRRPDLASDFRGILVEIAQQEISSGDGICRVAAWSKRAKSYAESIQEIDQGVKGLLTSLCQGLAPLAEDAEMSQGQIATISRISTTSVLTSAALRDAEQALLALAKTQSRSREAIRTKKEELQQIVLDVMRQFANDAAEIGAKSDRITSITENVLDSDDNAIIKESLMSLVAETQDLSLKMKQAQKDLAQRESDIAHSQQEIEALRQQLISVSQKVKEDSLTGVLNRRGLSEAASREISLAERKQQKLSLALLDIDDFKAFNDLLGHDGGDEALKYLADTLSGVLRPSDSITRFGGEEFVILLPHTSDLDAKNVLQRVQRALTKDLWLNQHQRLLTFSSGVTSWREHDTLSLMISRADHLMYCAKKQGKNRVFSDGDENHGP